MGEAVSGVQRRTGNRPEQERKLKPPHALALKKQFNESREQEYPWTYAVTKCVVEGAFDDLKKAYDNFFAGRAAYLTYKKKGQSHESFYLSNDKFTVGSHWISIPGLGRFILDQCKIEKGRGNRLAQTGNGQSGRKAALCRREQGFDSQKVAQQAQAGDL